MTPDPFNLERFVKAQASGIYDRALREIQRGRKRTHWMSSRKCWVEQWISFRTTDRSGIVPDVWFEGRSVRLALPLRGGRQIHHHVGSVHTNPVHTRRDGKCTIRAELRTYRPIIA